MLSRLPYQRHRPFYLALIVSLTSIVLALLFRPSLVIAIAASAFFLTYLITALWRMPRLTSQFLRNHAASSDEPAWIIFLIVLAAVNSAVFALFMLINQQNTPHWFDLAVTISAVPLGWATIHMMAALHYAHLYWQPQSTEVAVKAETEDARKGEKVPRGGLNFPGTTEPCGWDFVYFAYVIGMAAQTSDTNITITVMRQINTMHAIVSFAFNTVLVAAAVNVIVALGS
ncbi:DUF1345 domain-containing protein [Brucella sp. JSBI001]|jgi:uncharacterized membrane protein|uniref:DUF1345 domain-containing protein n=1 Tax=Brucella sp. JSBI001 TaxID=2886044 RepID=UPI002230DD25|nr:MULTISPECIES: DUF1345 domain-containing protein [Brucella]UZD70019.1 DUF1345 domain-containing protein [Brucella sp. JSBI001]